MLWKHSLIRMIGKDHVTFKQPFVCTAFNYMLVFIPFTFSRALTRSLNWTFNQSSPFRRLNSKPPPTWADEWNTPNKLARPSLADGKARDYGKGRYISDSCCGVRPITMHWVSWPIRADCSCRNEGLCRKQRGFIENNAFERGGA